MLNTLISSFNAGELSPYLQDRTSLEKYRNGCLVLENMNPTIYGTAHRRAGTQYLGQAGSQSTRSRLHGLNFSDSDRVVMEIGVGFIHFWRDTALISTANAVPVDYTGTPFSTVPSWFWYTEDELRSISIMQINRVIYLAHPNHPPMRLSYFSDTNVTLGEVSFVFAPMSDINVTSTTITPSAKTGSITLTSSTGIFTTDDVNSYYQLNHFNPSKFIEQGLRTDTTSSTIIVKGSYTLNTFGTWSGTLDLQQQGEDGVWYSIRKFSSALDYNAAYTAKTEDAVLLRMVTTGTSTQSSTTVPRAVLTPVDGLLNGMVRITQYNSATSVNATVIQTLGDTIATGMWYAGAFSKKKGYPNSVGLFEGRVCYAGTSTQPNTIWASASDDFQQFLLGVNTGDAITFTLSSTTAGRIQWMVGKSSLVVGTTTDEWAIASGNGSPLSATNITAKLQSRYGSTSISPLVVNETLLFFQRGNRKVREMSYSWQVDAWVSPDLTVLSEQAVRKGILERAYIRVPDGTMWVVTEDGGLTSMVYERDQQVAAFARHFTDGIIESVAAINGSGGEDEVWISVKRTIKASDGVTNIDRRYIEKLRLGVRTAVETGDKTGWWFSDSAKLVTSSTPFSTITGLDHLEGKTVQVWGDNAVVALAQNPTTSAYTVKNGTIYLGESVSRAIVGLPYTSKLSPMRVDHELNDGTSVGRKSRIPRIKVRVMNSIAGEFSSDNSTWFEMLSRTTQDKMDASPAPQDTFELLSVSGNWTYTPNLYLRQYLPMPMSVVSIVVIWETAENIRD